MRALLFLALLCAAPLAAQNPARGVFNYRVDGVYEGEAMEPWSMTAEVGDSAGSLTLHQVTVHGRRFDYMYIAGGHAAWLNPPGPSGPRDCTTTLKSEIPDFALPFALAASQLEAGGRIDLVMLKCVDTAVQRVSVHGDVANDTQGWKIVGGENYPFEVIISRDGRVLRFVQPQGTVGSAIYTLL